MDEERVVIVPEGAPSALGTYSPAVALGGMVYTSGQIGLDPASGELVAGGVEAETRQVLRNLAAVLEAAGSGLDQILKTTCFLADMGDFATFNAVYGEHFPSDPPARSTIGVAALPRGARVEIEAIGVRRG